MHANLGKLLGVCAAVAVLATLSAVVLVAQERPRLRDAAPGKNRVEVTVNRPVDGAQTADRSIAECLSIQNQQEIALATLAASKSDNPDVQKFAEMLVKEHNQILAQLQQFGAPRAASNTPREDQPGAADDAPDQNRDKRDARNRRDATGAAGAQHRTPAVSADGLNFHEIQREIGEKCLETAQQSWKEKEGDKASLCFVGQQAVVHQQMIDAQEVLRKYASPKLQEVIDQSISGTKAHLDQAEKLAEELAADSRASDKDRSK